MHGTTARSIVIVGNASTHHCDGSVELIQSTGALVIIYFYTIYPVRKCSPGCNDVFANVISDSCHMQGWFSDSGY